MNRQCSRYLKDELIKDMNTLAEEGIPVAISERTFTYKSFMFSWMADAMGRMKILGIGGPGKYVSCSNCWQHSNIAHTWKTRHGTQLDMQNLYKYGLRKEVTI